MIHEVYLVDTVKQEKTFLKSFSNDVDALNYAHKQASGYVNDERMIGRVEKGRLTWITTDSDFEIVIEHKEA
jgi:hypothetical protein